VLRLLIVVYTILLSVIQVKIFMDILVKMLVEFVKEVAMLKIVHH